MSQAVVSCAHTLDKDIADAETAMQKKRAAACYAECEKLSSELESVSGAEDAENWAAASELWQRAHRLFTNPNSFADVKQNDLNFKPIIKTLRSAILGKIVPLISQEPDLVEPLLEGLDEMAQVAKLDDLQDSFKTSNYARAVSKLNRWRRSGEAYGSIELVLAKDRPLIKQLLASYKACQNWDVSGVQAMLVDDLERLVQDAEKYLCSLVVADLKALRGNLVAKVAGIEPMLEKSAWKKDLGDSASWKSVVDAGKKALLAEGVGSRLQKGQKEVTKACTNFSVLCPFFSLTLALFQSPKSKVSESTLPLTVCIFTKLWANGSAALFDLGEVVQGPVFLFCGPHKAQSSLSAALMDYAGLAKSEEEISKQTCEEAKQKGVILTGVVFEGVLLTTMLEESTTEQRKKKIQEHFNKMHLKAKAFDTDLSDLVHPRLLREAGDVVLHMH